MTPDLKQEILRLWGLKPCGDLAEDYFRNLRARIEKATISEPERIRGALRPVLFLSDSQGTQNMIADSRAISACLADRFAAIEGRLAALDQRMDRVERRAFDLPDGVALGSPAGIE